MEVHCKDSHGFMADDPEVLRNERRTLAVVILTGLTMLVEVMAGYWSGSMSLLADGWHMGSHLGALSITYLVYRLSRSPDISRRFSFGSGKLVPLGGYTSALILAGIAVTMAVESIHRLRHPQVIFFDQAIVVAVGGLVVNLVSAWILGAHSHGSEAAPRAEHVHGAHSQGSGHGHDHGRSHAHGSDHNLRSAYLHVLADAVTSVLAIVALSIGKWKGAVWLDPAVGLVGVAVILTWSFQLCKETASDLLDAHPKSIDVVRLKGLFADPGTEILDFHIWRVAPKALACELIVKSSERRGAEYYRKRIGAEFAIQHIIVEERVS